MSTKINYSIYGVKNIDLIKILENVDLPISSGQTVDEGVVTNCTTTTKENSVQVNLNVRKMIYSQAEVEILLNNLLEKGYRYAKG